MLLEKVPDRRKRARISLKEDRTEPFALLWVVTLRAVATSDDSVKPVFLCTAVTLSDPTVITD